MTYGSRVAAAEEKVRHAASLGLNSVPTFVLDMQWAVPGAQPTEAFTRALEQAWAASPPGDAGLHHRGRGTGRQGLRPGGVLSVPRHRR